MKKIIIAIAAMLITIAASAQTRAIGIRAGWGAEISYQHGLGSNFVEADLGLFGNSFCLTGVYDFVFASTEGFDFYAGPGARVGFFNSVNEEGKSVPGLCLGVVGQIGARYNFASIPLGLSLDFRPTIGLIPGFGFGWNDGFALGIRYIF